ncbi:MAG: hypothetical protein HYX97_05940 [Chloroflexi bacterium]|nr:hypothetical protein [Chloroflexota bacterium]
MAAQPGAGNSAVAEQPKQAMGYPFANVGKLDTMVVVVYHDRANDVLVLRTTLSGNDSVTLPGEMTIRYDATNGDISSIQIRDFERTFLPSFPTLAEEWRQVQAAKPTPRRVESTPFLKGLFAVIRQSLDQKQDRWLFSRSMRERNNWT